MPRYVDNLTLDEWRLKNGLKPNELGRLIGCRVRMAYCYCLPLGNPEFRLPRPERMARIYQATNGEVRPDSFYRLPLITERQDPRQEPLPLEQAA